MARRKKRYGALRQKQGSAAERARDAQALKYNRLYLKAAVMRAEEGKCGAAEQALQQAVLSTQYGVSFPRWKKMNAPIARAHAKVARYCPAILKRIPF